MKLLLCIPAYNEADVIVPTVKEVAGALVTIPGLSWHILVADNASADGTAAKVREANVPYTSVISLSKKGKGLAIRAAAAYAADADLFGFIDADLSAHPASIPLLLEVLNTEADISIGSRLLRPDHVKRSALRTLSSKIFNVLRHSLLGIEVADSQCGLKIMNRRGVKVLMDCKEKKWFLDMELLARAQKQDLRIVEIPIEWNEYHYQNRKSKLSLWSDGFAAINAMMRIKARNL